MSKLAERSKPKPYKFEPSLERVLVSLSCNRPAFWDRIGHALEPDSLSEGPARVAMLAAREIAAESTSGPTSDRQEVQRLSYWKQLGRVTQEQIAAVEDLLDRAAGERDLWREEAAVAEARKVLKPRLEQQAIIKAHDEWSARGDLTPIAEELISASRIGMASPDGPPVEAPPPWPTLDPAALYGPAGDFVRRAAPHTEADPAGLLLQFLVAAGAVLGRGPWCVAGGARHHGNLFSVIVGQTAKSRKGTAWSLVSSLFREVDLETWSQIGASGLSSGEGLIHAVRDRRTEWKEDKETGKWEEATVDPGAKDKRLMVHEGEFARPLTVSGRETNILSAVMRTAWDTGDLRNLVRHSAERASDAHISVVGHITESELNRTLSETDQSNGYANRILWCLVRRTKLLPDDDGFRVERDLVDLIEQVRLRLGVVDRLAAQGARELGGAAAQRQTGTELDAEWHRDDAAKALWREQLYPRLAMEGDDPTDPAADVICRAEAQATRLSLIFAVLDASHEIRPEHLLAADAVWRYCRDSARRIFSAPRKRDVKAERVLTALRDAEPDGLGRYDIRRTVFGGHISEQGLAELLERLLRRGLVQKEIRPTRGRSAEVWHAGALDPCAGSAGSAGRSGPSGGLPAHTALKAQPPPLPPDLVCAYGRPCAGSAGSAGSPQVDSEPDGEAATSFDFGANTTQSTEATPPPPPPGKTP